jgi:hypothetical protein
LHLLGLGLHALLWRLGVFFKKFVIKKNTNLERIKIQIELLQVGCKRLRHHSGDLSTTICLQQVEWEVGIERKSWKVAKSSGLNWFKIENDCTFWSVMKTKTKENNYDEKQNIFLPFHSPSNIGIIMQENLYLFM